MDGPDCQGLQEVDSVSLVNSATRPTGDGYLFARPDAQHNVLLQQGVHELRRSYPSATVAYADYFYAYGRRHDGAAVTVTRACCGAYNFDMDRMCGARPDERISWDGVHPTQRAYRVMTDLLYHTGAPVRGVTGVGLWGLAMEVGGDARRDVVEGRIREAIAEEKGREMRKRATEWKEAAARATRPRGSSFDNLDGLINDVLLKSS
ncbi:acetylajmalan esterase-like [Panicum miliaceum]|uniref:Acetylajmalan esterase-like n=1 Tax=Panicum miliaceum TaxID=4540 RepID=A0A3L6RMX5_PANMI|nr:acetylajmalan esterase-like [Panicum miliaceum]